MRVFYTLVLLFTFEVVTAQLTPQPSPGASLSQTVGITKIDITYSRPGVKGREIFGKLVPFAKVWRTGANAPTVITVSNDVTINGAELKAGKYAILTFPYANEWILVFTNDTEATQDTYTEENDALRLHVDTYEIPFTETFTIDMSNIQYDAAFLNFYWENTAITVELEVNNEQAVSKSMEQKSLETAGAFLQASEYFISQGLDLEKALEYAEKSILLKETFRNNWAKARVLKEMGAYEDALNFTRKAKEMGADKPIYTFFKNDIEKAIIELKLLTPQLKD